MSSINHEKKISRSYDNILWTYLEKTENSKFFDYLRPAFKWMSMSVWVSMDADECNRCLGVYGCLREFIQVWYMVYGCPWIAMGVYACYRCLTRKVSQVSLTDFNHSLICCRASKNKTHVIFLSAEKRFQGVNQTLKVTGVKGCFHDFLYNKLIFFNQTGWKIYITENDVKRQFIDNI